MNITFEPTPNPATMKFNLGVKVTDSAFECPNSGSTERSPLAAKIFGFPWTSSVFIGTDFVTVTKQDWVDWAVLAKPLSGLIQEHIASGQPVVVELKQASTDNSDVLPTDSDVVKKIKLVIQNQIRPVVALDGGDIVFADYQDNVVSIKMKGACAGCPSSAATLKDGIETTLRHEIPEIREVISV